jgi:hypothetical protein
VSAKDVIIYEDNQSAIAVSKDTAHQGRTKHIREIVAEGDVKVATATQRRNLFLRIDLSI